MATYEYARCSTDERRQDIDRQTDLMNCTEIDMQKLDEDIRLQRSIFETAAQVYDLMSNSWQNQGTKYALLGQVIRLVEEYQQFTGL